MPTPSKQKQKQKKATRAAPAPKAGSRITELVDRYVILNKRYKEFEKEREEVRKAIIETGLGLKTGTDCDLMLTETSYDALDTAKIKEEMSVSWIKDHSKTVTKINVAIHPKSS